MTIANKLALLEQTKEVQRVKLGLPESVPFSQYVNFIRDLFTPAELFENGGQGVWFDPSDLSTMFQDVKGTEPVTKDGDPVGLILDKSQGLELGMNLSNPSNWTGEIVETGAIIFSDSKILFNDPAVSNPNVILNKSNIAGKRYKIEFKVDLNSKGYVMACVYGTPLNSSYLSVTSNGTYSVIFTSTGNNLLGFRLSGVGSVSDIKIREIKGNHATQLTATSRPIYRTDGELHWSEFDGVDDTLSVQLPTGIYTEVKASRDGVTHKYPVNVDGSYILGDLTQTKQSVSGLVLVNRQLTQTEIDNVTNLMKAKAGLPL